MPRTLFLSVVAAALLTLSAAQAIADPTCLFNATHCACRANTSPGTCLRKDSGTASSAMCTVSTCSASGYSCDCLGSHICARRPCANWVAKDGTIASRLPKDASVACVEKTDGVCLSKVQLPVEYKMMQFGSATPNNAAGTMFNMTALTDSGDTITESYNMGDKWDHHDALRYRHITLRLYQSPSSGDKFLCGIYNTYGLPNDGLGRMRVTVTITGLAGQQLRWVACDDRLECKGGPASILTASHRVVFTHSDGWCVKPDESDGQGIRIKFTDVQGFEGVSFQLSDGVDDAYYFDDGPTNGLSGLVDDNALVKDGEVPDILFSLAGIEVPQ